MSNQFEEMFPLNEDSTEYRLLTKNHISLKSFDGKEIVSITPEGLTLLAETAFTDVSHMLRPSHLALLSQILDDSESSENDRYVANQLLKNAVIAAGTAGLDKQSSMPTARTTCAIHKTPLSACTKKKIPAPTCPLKSNFTQVAKAPITFFSWQKAAARPTKPFFIRKQKQS